MLGLSGPDHQTLFIRHPARCGISPNRAPNVSRANSPGSAAENFNPRKAFSSATGSVHSTPASAAENSCTVTPGSRRTDFSSIRCRGSTTDGSDACSVRLAAVPAHVHQRPGESLGNRTMRRSADTLSACVDRNVARTVAAREVNATPSGCRTEQHVAHAPRHLERHCTRTARPFGLSAAVGHFDETPAPIPVDVGHPPRPAAQQQHPWPIDILGEQISADGAHLNPSGKNDELRRDRGLYRTGVGQFAGG